MRDPEKIVLGKEIRIKVECPSTKFPEDVVRPKVELLVLTLVQANWEQPSILNQLFGLKEELAEAKLDLVAKRGLLHTINLADEIDSFAFSCPKLPADTDARIGVRRDPKNPNRKEKIFGFNAVIATSVELTLGIELPVACITIAGNSQEGNQYIPLKEQIAKYQGRTSKVDLADAKYDELHNYEFSRAHGAIPVIDYNVRNEKVNLPALKQRGYDQNGWPFAPCGALTRPNGFDFASQRANFSCRRQCLETSNPDIKKFADHCPHWINYQGFSTHMSIKQFPPAWPKPFPPAVMCTLRRGVGPRLITEVIRGTPRHKELKALRPASERINSTAKDGLNILTKPKIRGLGNAGILAFLAVMAVMLKRIAAFIVKVTLALRKKRQDAEMPQQGIYLPGPKVPKFIWNLIQRE